ncbi:hypothetical protein M0R36_04355 [bacterium]|jgi:hypothetical protein|nr:hypothetical protein [bacterium]
MANYHQRFTFDSFIKAIDSDLLAQYFSAQRIAVPDGVSINDPEVVRKLIASCDQGKRLIINEELRRTNDLAVRQMERVMEVISEYEIKYVEDEKPITTCLRTYFCKDRDVFDKLYDYYLYDIYSERLYYYRFDKEQYKFSEKNLDAKVDKFQSEMAEHFKKDGKGDDCVIRRGKDGDEHFFIIMRGNGIKTDYEFSEKKVRMLTFHQAKQELVIFNPKTGTISVTSGIRKMGDKKKYVESFGVNILGLSEVPELTFQEELVKTDPLKDESFYQPTKDIEKITVRQAVLLRKGKVFTTITVKSNDVLESFNQMHLKLEYYDIKSMALRFKLYNVAKEIPVEIIPPEHTEIKHREGDEIIKKYLKEKGVLLV